MPRAPLAVTATIDLTDKITVSWEASAGATSYKVYRNTTPTPVGATLLASGVTGTSYDDAALTSGPFEAVRYYFVKATDGVGDSGFSGVATGWMDYPVPATPTYLTAETIEGGGVHLEWPNVNYTFFWELYRDGVLIATIPAIGADDEYDDTATDPGASYTYTLKAVNFTGSSAASAGVDAYAGGLETPEDVEATEDHLDKVTVMWAAVTNATSYNIYRSGTLIDNTASLTYDDTSATPGVGYTYRVAAVNAHETGTWSAAANGQRVRISNPATVSASANLTTGVNVTWSAVSGALSYEVYRGGSLLASGLTGTSYSDAAAADCDSQLYTVKAVRSDNVSTGTTGAYGLKRPTGDLCLYGGGNSTTTGASAADGYSFCGNPAINWYLNAFTVADSFQIYLDGLLVVDLANVTGEHTGSFGVGGGAGTHSILVLVTPGSGSTQWSYSLSC